MLDRTQPRSLRACSRDDPEDGARRGVPRRRLVTVAPGGDGKPPAGHYDPDAGSSAATEPNLPKRKLRRGSGERSAAPKPKIATVRAPGGGRPPYGDARRLARCLACPDSAGPTDASQASVRLSALRHPFVGVARSQKQNPGAKRAAGTKSA